MKKALLLLSLCFCFSVSAQTVVSVELQESLSIEEIQEELPITALYPVENYKVLYETTDVNGLLDTASGMLSLPIPDEGLRFPLGVYNHGTVPAREAVPSRMGVFERAFVYAFSTNGFIMVAPDYLGLGDSRGIHPYLHAETEARSGRDLLIAVKGWLEEQDIPYNDQLFITGYSQGGHASAALHRDIQENPGNDGLVVTGAAHLSGPYSVSGVMKEIVTQNQAATFPGYLAQTYISYSLVYGLYENIESVFVPPYVNVVQQYLNQEIEPGQMNDSLEVLLIEQEETLQDMFQDSIIDILANEPDHPINVALRDNDLFSWAPQAPTFLVYCTEDEQVPFRNAIIADSVMNAMGAPLTQARNGGALDHGGCVEPAFFTALLLFNSLGEVISSTEDPIAAQSIGSFYAAPNPVRIGEAVTLSIPAGETLEITLEALDGRQLKRYFVGADNPTLTLPPVPAGTYLLRSLHKGKVFIDRIVVH